jgi:hypothetical protein
MRMMTGVEGSRFVLGGAFTTVSIALLLGFAPARSAAGSLFDLAAALIHDQLKT